MFHPIQGVRLTFDFGLFAEEGLAMDLLDRVQQEVISETNPALQTGIQSLKSPRMRATLPSPSRTDGAMMDTTN